MKPANQFETVGNSPITCPISGSTDIRKVTDIAVADLVQLYKRRRGVDISNEFSVSDLTLYYTPKIDFYFFWPFVTGSQAFYSDFITREKYMSSKYEFEYAAKFVASKDKVLDVGCGIGEFSESLPTKENYLGLELSEKAVTEAAQFGRNLKVERIEDHAISHSGTYDAVALFQVLEHVDQPLSFLNAAVECLKTDGTCIISVPSTDNFNTLLQNVYLNFPPHHISWWTLDALKFVGSKLGLQLEDYSLDTIDKSTARNNIAAVIQRSINETFRRKNKLISTDLSDLIIEAISKGLAQLVSKGAVETTLAGHGHSITAIFKKTNLNGTSQIL